MVLEAAGALSEEQRAHTQRHLANCVDCRACSIELRKMTGGLRRLSARPVEPSANFRHRWTTGVERAKKAGTLAQAVAEWMEWGRQIAWRNRRVLSALAPVWVLILVFKLTAPDMGHPASMAMARSPIEIFRAVKASNNTQIAFDQLYEEPVPPKAPATSPRSSRETAQPMGCRRESGINPEPDLLS
jgi:anti-sigma factor RsiW